MSSYAHQTVYSDYLTVEYNFTDFRLRLHTLSHLYTYCVYRDWRVLCFARYCLPRFGSVSREPGRCRLVTVTPAYRYTMQLECHRTSEKWAYFAALISGRYYRSATNCHLSLPKGPKSFVL